MKITKFKEDITSEVANSFEKSIAIDTEATGLQIPERDKLSLIQISDANGNVFIIQPNKNNFYSVSPSTETVISTTTSA